MSRHQRLQKTMRSPQRQARQRHNRAHRQLHRAVHAAFMKVIAPLFPPGTWDKPRTPKEPTP